MKPYPRKSRKVTIRLTIRTNLPVDDLVRRLNAGRLVPTSVSGCNVDRGTYEYDFVRAARGDRGKDGSK